jgi:hypothetical protein
MLLMSGKVNQKMLKSTALDMIYLMDLVTHPESIVSKLSTERSHSKGQIRGGPRESLGWDEEEQ